MTGRWLIVLTLVDDTSEFNGATIVKLLPSVRLSIRDQLTEATMGTPNLGGPTAPVEDQLKEGTKT
jgi:hypothetical protein